MTKEELMRVANVVMNDHSGEYDALHKALAEALINAEAEAKK